MTVNNATVEKLGTGVGEPVIVGAIINVVGGGKVFANGNYRTVSTAGSGGNITITGRGSVVENINESSTKEVIYNYSNSMEIIISDSGAVVAKGTQTAILSNGNVEVLGGRVTATNGSAIILGKQPGYALTATAIIKDGGLVFSYQGNTTQTSTTNGSGVIIRENGEFATVENTGMVIGWNKTGGTISYNEDTITDIVKLTDNNSGTAVWAKVYGKSGISYTNGDNTGFISLEGEVTVNTDHTVTFNPNGGTVDETSRPVTSGEAVGTLPIPTRPGSYSFNGWYTEASGGIWIDENTTVSNDVTYYAQWTHTGGGGSGSGGGSPSNDSSSNVIVTVPTPDRPNSPTQGEIRVPGTVDDRGNVIVSITNSDVTEAFDKALADARNSGMDENGITVVLRADSGSRTGSGITVNLPKAVQDTIITKGIANTIVVVESPDIRVGMDLASVKEINRQAKSDVSITATPTDTGRLTPEARSVIGSRPVYDLRVNYGNGNTVSSFGAGSVSVTIPYTPAENEKPENIRAVYVDSNGRVHWLTNSVYDRDEKVLRFSTGHFSTYGVGYRQTDMAFTDIAGHWAEDSIEFVVNRGLFSGTSSTAFSPNIPMTRGMFVTVLGQLANADISGYTESSFSDVKSDAYYRGYIEWASRNSIVKGVGNGRFAPDQAITREQMAVIISSYARAIGYALPEVHAENSFSDNGKISTYAREAVKELQTAGVISGRNNSLFDPQGTATRAEASAVLSGFVELAVSGGAMQSWTMNGSGRWMYYENGTPVTGNKDIEGSTYTFDRYGATQDVPKNLRYTTYTVQSGDSFWSISRKLGCSTSELERLNNRSRFSIIFPGDVLRVPEK